MAMTNLAYLVTGLLDLMPEPEPEPVYIPHQWSDDVYEALKFQYLNQLRKGERCG